MQGTLQAALLEQGNLYLSNQVVQQGGALFRPATAASALLCRVTGNKASVEYIARTKRKGVPHHAKAGNINSALLKETPGKVRRRLAPVAVECGFVGCSWPGLGIDASIWHLVAQLTGRTHPPGIQGTNASGEKGVPGAVYSAAAAPSSWLPPSLTAPLFVWLPWCRASSCWSWTAM